MSGGRRNACKQRPARWRVPAAAPPRERAVELWRVKVRSVVAGTEAYATGSAACRQCRSSPRVMPTAYMQWYVF